MANVPELFGTAVFNEKVMKQRLPKDVFRAVQKTIEDGSSLDISVATAVANAMKDWAIEKGATHYSHWFQPMTGITAEKHDSFILPVSNSEVVMEFKGKELIKGEPDASSFPSGGLRATFEARGYTAWDPTSFAFVRDGTLYIPSAFCAHTGQVLDKKTPVLRSCQALDTQVKRILKLFGKETTHVDAQVGAEQEYFLVDKELYNRRKDLIFTGRTLIGAKPPKGQELEDHYFGSIKTRVAEFMKDLDETLWTLGVVSKTKHNEAAPAQHELAPLFNTVNISADQNQLIMEEMKRVAERHGLVCLLHEKPFEGVNGSGKHNNWSMSAAGIGNLLDPGKSPQDNMQFLLFLCAVIEAIDEHADLLRVSIASAGNDHRLGGNEAPPAIISIFLGEELTQILENIEKGDSFEGSSKVAMELGVDLLPKFKKDATDRNRTSPVAFTGNKFEFRMPGSGMSVGCINYITNTIVADVLSKYADRLEKAHDFNKELKVLLRESISEHKRILFNGNNYSDEWVKEAEHRGLPNLGSTADALPTFIKPENIALFERHKILSESEIRSRYEIILETYCKINHIEGLTLLDMEKKDIIPAVIKYSSELASGIVAKKSAGVSCMADLEIVSRVSSLSDSLFKEVEELQKIMDLKDKGEELSDKANYYAKQVLPAMKRVREITDKLETMVPATIWPIPTYSDLMFSE